MLGVSGDGMPNVDVVPGPLVLNTIPDGNLV